MAKLIYGLNQSLDGYVDHDHPAFAPRPALFRYFIEESRRQAGCIYGRTMYGLMRYWDDDQPDWGPDERAFAEAWRANPKWVVSRSLNEVGPNAELIAGDLEEAVRRLKETHDGEIEVAGPKLAQSLTDLGLIDEYHIYLHPVVVGTGQPFFAGKTPPLHLVSSDRIDDDVLRLVYVPA